jgi:predicted aspartyl protease
MLVRDVQRGKHKCSELKQEMKKSDRGSIPHVGRVNGVELQALVDIGASNSFISKDLVEKNRWKINAKKGIIQQAMKNAERKRIGTIEAKIEKWIEGNHGNC